MSNRITEIRRHLKSVLSPGRYEHTISVSYTCICLAMCHGYAIEQAEIAGLLHDCAKRYPEQLLIELCQRQKIELSAAELEAPAVVHAKYGAWIAKYQYHIENPEILDAIRCHTTGKPEMTLLDKILYVADYIEPRRFKAYNLTEMRTLAFQDLDQCLYLILESTLSFLKNKNCFIHPLTQQAFDYYRNVTTIVN